MYSIHFARTISTTTHLVKHTIQNDRIIPTFHGSLLEDKDMVDHHYVSVVAPPPPLAKEQ